MLADPRYDGAVVETAEDVERLLDETERKLSIELRLDTKSLRAELLRKLRQDEIDEYAHGGLVADWIYYRSAVMDWAATSSRTPEKAPPPTCLADNEVMTKAAECGLRRIMVSSIARLLSNISRVHCRRTEWARQRR